MNWSRAELKTRAKAVLKKHYLKLFLVSLILMIAGANQFMEFDSHSSFRPNRHYRETRSYTISREIGEGHEITINIGEDSPAPMHGRSRSDIRYAFNDRNLFGLTGKFLAGALVTLIIGAVILMAAFMVKIFVLFPLEVGGRKVFIKCADNVSPPDMKLIKTSFTGGFYPNMVKTGFLMNFKILLGLLLFIVPGIIKIYEYYFVPYILADNPGIDSNRALEISRRMTNGQKFNIFKLELSFIGWYILGSAIAGIGSVFVLPYRNATQAQVYQVLKEEAVLQGVASPAEFGDGTVDLREDAQHV